MHVSSVPVIRRPLSEEDFSLDHVKCGRRDVLELLPAWAS